MKQEKFVIHGGKKLHGEIEVRGAKNAATPILAATILASGDCVIGNLPMIEDVLRMLDILKSMGAQVDFIGKHKVKINTADIDPAKMDFHLVCQLRSSILLMGALFSRFSKFKIPSPGGCIIGARPLDAHLEVFRDLGAKIKGKDDNFQLKRGELSSRTIVLKEFSVTATENAILASVFARGKTVVKIAASEPNVLDLIAFLNKMGACISWRANHTLEIEGVKKLCGVDYKVMYDPIEAGTFLILGAASKSEIRVKNANPEHLDLVLRKLQEFGARFEIGKNFIKTLPPKKLQAAKVKVEIYPGIPTDLQAPFAVMATQSEGTSLIHEHMYEGRLRYLKELSKMGAKTKMLDPHRGLISGPTPLHGKEIKSFDLRAGATLIIAALIAEGESVINNIYQIDRGYERIEERLRGIGAEIERK